MSLKMGSMDPKNISKKTIEPNAIKAKKWLAVVVVVVVEILANI